MAPDQPELPAEVPGVAAQAIKFIAGGVVRDANGHIIDHSSETAALAILVSDEAANVVHLLRVAQKEAEGQ